MAGAYSVGGGQRVHKITIVDDVSVNGDLNNMMVAKALSGMDSRRLCGYKAGVLMLTTTQDYYLEYSVDKIEISWNNSDWYAVQSGIGLSITTPGVDLVAMTGSYGLPGYVRLNVSGLSPPLTFSAQLQFSTSIDD